jgi:uncharacterized protein
MKEQAAINSLEFAEKSLEIHGTIALFAFPRLGDVLFSHDGELQYSLRGERNERGEPAIRLHVTGELKLSCQRCLGSLGFGLDSVVHFVVVRSEDDLPAPEDEQDDVEYLVANRNQEILPLIEDEVLLSLPLAPAHENAQCSGAGSLSTEQKESPFRVLQGLKLKKD